MAKGNGCSQVGGAFQPLRPKADGHVSWRRMLLTALALASTAWSEDISTLSLHESKISSPTTVVASETVVASAPLAMSVDECVALAVRRNTTIKLAYMDRVLAKYNFTTAHDYAFRPTVSLTTTTGRNGSRSES